MNYSSIVLRLREYVKTRGLFFYCNLVIFASFVFLAWQVVKQRALPPGAFRLHLTFVMYASALGLVALVYAWVIFFKDRGFQKYIFWVIVVMFAILELVAKFLYVIPYKEQSYRYPQPYVMFTARPDSTFYVRDVPMRHDADDRIPLIINSMGVRVESTLLKEKPKGEYRVFMLGGSTVFNGSPLSETIAGQLEQQFQKNNHPNVKVYNFGVMGYVTTQEMIMALQTIVDYHPDLVVMYDGGNDLYQPFELDPRPGYPYNFMAYEAGIARVEDRASVTQLLDTIFYNSRLVRLFFGNALEDSVTNLQELRTQAQYRSPSWEKSITDIYNNNHEKMCYLAKGFNFKLAVFLQPMVYFKNHLAGKESTYPQQDPPMTPYMLRQYDVARQDLAGLEQKFSGDNQCLFSDMSQMFRDYDKEVFWDIIHIDNHGNEMVAQEMYNRLMASKALFGL